MLMNKTCDLAIFQMLGVRNIVHPLHFIPYRSHLDLDTTHVSTFPSPDQLFTPSCFFDCELAMSILKQNQYEDGGYKVAIVSAVLILMQLLMVCGRYYSRRLQKLLLQADDYVLSLATVGRDVGFHQGYTQW